MRKPGDIDTSSEAAGEGQEEDGMVAIEPQGRWRSGTRRGAVEERQECMGDYCVHSGHS